MKLLYSILALILTSFCFSQESIPKVLDKFNKKSVPYISVNELQRQQNIILLDTREIKEFNISHIENAINVGYNQFKINKIPKLIQDKNITIVVYCSIGIRSEKIGAQILKLGYKNVFNLYGGIFEWKNNGYKLFNQQNLETNEIHTFSKEWSVYLKNGEKIYEN